MVSSGVHRNPKRRFFEVDHFLVRFPAQQAPTFLDVRRIRGTGTGLIDREQSCGEDKPAMYSNRSHVVAQIKADLEHSLRANVEPSFVTKADLLRVPMGDLNSDLKRDAATSAAPALIQLARLFGANLGQDLQLTTEKVQQVSTNLHSVNSKLLIV